MQYIQICIHTYIHTKKHHIPTLYTYIHISHLRMLHPDSNIFSKLRLVIIFCFAMYSAVEGYTVMYSPHFEGFILHVSPILRVTSHM